MRIRSQDNVMDNKTYRYQTTLEIRLNLGKDITDIVNRALIKFKKPNGFEGYWTADIIDPALGIISYTFPTSSLGLDDTGFWTFWGYLYYKDGTVDPGDPIQIGVYKEGKTYIAFPYGRQSGDSEETEMAQEAFEILYDNTNSEMVGSNVQEAIDELDNRLDNTTVPAATSITYDNSGSGLTSTTVQAAIDEVNTDVDVINALMAQSNQLIYVDINRIDTYVEDGTINKPFKGIASAIAIISETAVIQVSAGTYPSNIVIPTNTNLIGMGAGKTFFTGTISTPVSGNCSLKEFTAQNSITISTDTVVTNVDVATSNGAPAVSIAGDLRAYNFNISSTDFDALAISSGLAMIENSIISTTSATHSAVRQAGGSLILETVEMDNNSTEATLNSTGGTVRVMSTRLSNAGAGLAISINNGATSASPNVLANIIQAGGVETNTAYTVLEGVEGGDPVGTVFSRRPASQIGYDNTYSNITADNLQTALDAIYGSSKSGAGAPAHTPTNDVEFYYDTTGDILYVWNNSTTDWHQVVTT